MSTSSPVLLLHIFAATVGLLSGFLSMVLRKGSGLHRVAGNVFFVSMLTMSATAVFIATFLLPNRSNVLIGLLTFYLVATAWSAARRRDGGTSLFDVRALVFVLAVAALGVASGVQAAGSVNGTKDGVSAGFYFFVGSLALLGAISDIRMLRLGGVTGPRRIARHLYRMCFALLIATFSFYPGQGKLFAGWLRESGVLVLPHLFLIGSLIYWRFKVMGKRKRTGQQAVVPSVERGTWEGGATGTSFVPR
jgi:uncharacterized membrane protein